MDTPVGEHGSAGAVHQPLRKRTAGLSELVRYIYDDQGPTGRGIVNSSGGVPLKFSYDPADVPAAGRTDVATASPTSTTLPAAACVPRVTTAITAASVTTRLAGRRRTLMRSGTRPPIPTMIIPACPTQAFAAAQAPTSPRCPCSPYRRKPIQTGATTRWAYDARGNPVIIVDPRRSASPTTNGPPISPDRPRWHRLATRSYDERGNSRPSALGKPSGL